MSGRLPIIALFAASLIAFDASAECLNRFVRRTEGSRLVVTFLTGKLTFQEAQVLAKVIAKKTAKPLQWVDPAGKTLATQIGLLNVVRPMPVGCDGKTSGVVMIAMFSTVGRPSNTMNVKIDDSSTITFLEQGK